MTFNVTISDTRQYTFHVRRSTSPQMQAVEERVPVGPLFRFRNCKLAGRECWHRMESETLRRRQNTKFEVGCPAELATRRKGSKGNAHVTHDRKRWWMHTHETPPSSLLSDESIYQTYVSIPIPPSWYNKNNAVLVNDKIITPMHVHTYVR